MLWHVKYKTLEVNFAYNWYLNTAVNIRLVITMIRSMGIKYNFQIKLEKKFKCLYLWCYRGPTQCKIHRSLEKDHKNKRLGLTLKSTKINHHPFQYYYPLLKKKACEASLVAQWLRVCLLMQGTRVQALVWQYPTCRGTTRPVSHNYWACASGACAPQQERPR